MKTVLVVCGGGLQGMALIEALRRVAQIRVVLMDNHADNVGRYLVTRFVQAPALADEAAFLSCLLRVCREESVDFVFPATDRELGLLARERETIESTGVVLMVSDDAVLAVGRDKLALSDWLGERGLPALPTTLDPVKDGLPLPWHGKPRFGWGSRGVLTVRTMADHDALPKPLDGDMVWQPLIEDFDEFSVDLAVNQRRQISPLAVRRRVRTLSGFSLLCEPMNDPDIAHLAGNVAQALAAHGARGVLNFQILRFRGQSWVSDLNPRVGTSMPLSLAAGRNPVAFLLGQDDEPSGQQRLVRTFRALHERAVPALGLGSVRGVVFDLDETLLDQKDWIGRKLQQVWLTHQDELPPRDRFLQQMHWLLEEGHRADLIDAYRDLAGIAAELGHRLIETFRAAVPTGCRLYDDATPVLYELRRRGYRLGLLTDNPAASQRMKLRVAGLAPAFDSIVFTAELATRKPDARCFSAVAEALVLDLGELVMVGDNLYRDALGSLDAGLAQAFLVRQPGAMFDFGPSKAWPVVPPDRLASIQALTELLWHLQGPNRDD